MHAGYHRVVRSYVLDERDGWRVCCGSGCDPCMLRLGRIVDRIRSEWRG